MTPHWLTRGLTDQPRPAALLWLVVHVIPRSFAAAPKNRYTHLPLYPSCTLQLSVFTASFCLYLIGQYAIQKNIYIHRWFGLPLCWCLLVGRELNSGDGTWIIVCLWRRIDANVDTTHLNIEAAHTELVKYFQSVTSNRWLMIKIFGVLVVFFIIFVIFVA